MPFFLQARASAKCTRVHGKTENQKWECTGKCAGPREQACPQSLCLRTRAPQKQNKKAKQNGGLIVGSFPLNQMPKATHIRDPKRSLVCSSLPSKPTNWCSGEGKPNPGRALSCAGLTDSSSKSSKVKPSLPVAMRQVGNGPSRGQNMGSSVAREMQYAAFLVWDYMFAHGLASATLRLLTECLHTS